MNRSAALVGTGQALLILGLWAGIAGRWFPLGVPGEWEWQRLPASIRVDPLPLAGAGLVVIGFAGFAALGVRALQRSISVARETAWVTALAVVSIVAQGVVQEGAPEGYGLAKWIVALQSKGSSGYATVARTEMPAGIGAFLRTYPAWIERQDSLHIGTHPPGLFIVARILGDLTRAHPDLARWVVDQAPGSIQPAIRTTRGIGSLPRDEAAALVLTGALTLIGSALTVIPLYLLARARGTAPLAWGAATLWPLLPGALLFQPTPDTAFSFLSMAALASAAWSVRLQAWPARIVLAIGAGTILAIGMQFTLVFLAVGLVVAILLGFTPSAGGWRSRVLLMGLVGLGFGLATGGWWLATQANPMSIWWSNQQHHAGFYRNNPRSWWAWTGENLVESLVAVGLPTSFWVLLALRSPRSIPTSCWAALAVLVLLTASGRSLSEVARLWLPMYPPFLVAAAGAWERQGVSSTSLGGTIALVGVQTLVLQCLIQVVYPI